MFQSFARSIKSIAKGPHSILASQIAKFLSEHFVVDPEGIESSLLQDSRIVLKNAQLRQRRYRSSTAPSNVICVKGVVEEVVFTWRWSLAGDGGSVRYASSATGYASAGGMIQDVVLTIKGLKTLLSLYEWDTLDESEQALIESCSDDSSILENSSTGADSRSEEKESFVQRYVQQIIDHITLKILDFEFIVQAGDNGASIIMGGSKLELGTLASAKVAIDQQQFKNGDKTETMLSQKLSMEQFSVRVGDEKSKQRHPFIEPFSYVASVTRVCGVRFQSGILSGLEIVGMTDSVDEGILLHINQKQIQTLSIIGMLLSPITEVKPPLRNDDTLLQITGDNDKSDNIASKNNSTVFNLTLPMLMIILSVSEPNAKNSTTKIILPKTNLLYRTDGDVFYIKSSEGIKLNDSDHFLKLENGDKWCIDFVSKTFVLEGRSVVHNYKCSTVTISDDVLGHLAASINKLLSNSDLLRLQSTFKGREDKKMIEQKGINHNNSLDDSWSITISATIDVCLISDASKVAEASITSCFITISKDSLGGYKPSKMEIGQTSFKSSVNKIYLMIPPSSLISNTLVISDNIQLNVESVHEANKFKDFFISFVEKIKLQNATKSNDQVSMLPFSIKCEGLKCHIDDDKIDINVKKLLTDGISFESDYVTLRLGCLKFDLYQLTSLLGVENSNSLMHFSCGIALSCFTTTNNMIFLVLKTTLMKLTLLLQDSILNIKLVESFGLRLERPRKEWIEGKINPFEVSSNLNDPFHLFSLASKGVSITRSSFGEINVMVPNTDLVSTSEGAKLKIGESFDDLIDMNVESLATLEKMHEVISKIQTQYSYEKNTERHESLILPYLIVITRSQLVVQDQFVNISAEMVKVTADTVEVDKMTLSGANEEHCVLRELQFNLESYLKVKISEIDEVNHQSVCLVESIHDVIMTYKNNSLNVELDCVKFALKKECSDTERISLNAADIMIPFGIGIHVNSFHIVYMPMEDIHILISDIQLNADYSDEVLNIDTDGLIKIQASYGYQWLQATIDPLFIALSKDIASIHAISFGGFNICNSSFGKTKMRVPSFTFLPDSKNINFEEPIVAQIRSIEVAQKLKEFVSSTLQLGTQDDSLKTHPLSIGFNVTKLEVDVEEPLIKITGNMITFRDLFFGCTCLTLVKGNGISTCIENIEGELKSDICVKIGLLSSLDMNGMIKLEAPVNDAHVLYKKNDGLLINLNTVHLILDQSKIDTTSSSSAGDEPNLLLSEPINIKLKKLCMKNHEEDRIINVESIDVLVTNSAATYSLHSKRNIMFRLVRSPEEFIEVSMGGFSAQLEQSNGLLVTKTIDISGAKIGPCSPSLGELTILFPPIAYEQGDFISFQEELSISVDSIDIFQKLDNFLKGIFGSASEMNSSSLDKICFPVQIPGIRCLLSSPSSMMHIGKVTAIASRIDIEDVNLIGHESISASMKGLSLDLSSTQLVISRIQSMSIPGIISLTNELENLSIILDSEILKISILSPIYLATTAMSSKKQVTDDSICLSPTRTRNENYLNIPLTLQISMNEVHISKLDHGKESTMQLKEIILLISPQILLGNDLLHSEVQKGAKISLSLGHFSHYLIKVTNTRVSFLSALKNFDTINQLDLNIDTMKLTAGFSSLDWSSIFSLEKKKHIHTSIESVMKTPFAQIGTFNLDIVFDSQIIGSKSKIIIPSFSGNIDTTSNDLVAYYSKIVISRVPGFLVNAEVLGASVVESSLANGGRIIGGSVVGSVAGSLTGAGVGSVVGTAVSDGLKGAVAAGKSARNADATEAYKFGDVTRGIRRGISNATLKGAESRGSDGSDYIPGDLTVGAVTGIGNYASNNKGKLISAGGAGTGSMIGLAVAGPLGFIAGSYLGGKIGETLVEKDDKTEPCNNNKSHCLSKSMQASIKQHQQLHTSVHMTRHHHSQENKITQDCQQQHQPNLKQPNQCTGMSFNKSMSNKDLGNGQPQTGSPYHGTQSKHHAQWQQQQQYQKQQAHYQHQEPHQKPQNQGGYKFGDITKGIIARGKQVDGRNRNDNYKFGDFTRGLFK